MLNVRSRAGVIAVTTSAAVFVGLPVVAFGQVPVVEPVVNGVTETANSIVQAPVAPPSLPAPPAPPPAPAPAAPAPAPAPQVQLPAVPSAPKPAAQAPAAPAPAAGNTGAVQTRGAGAASKRSGGGGKAAARRSANAADRSAKRGEHRGDRSKAKAKASGDAGSTPAEEQTADRSEVALASQEADALPDDASPAKLPFSGLQLALMAIAGLAALTGGMALRRGALHFRRAAS